MQNMAKRVIDKCGGAKRLAAVLKISYHTVYNWAYRDGGVIPAAQQKTVLFAARRAGIDLSPADFFPPKIPKVRERKKKARQRVTRPDLYG